MASLRLDAYIVDVLLRDLVGHDRSAATFVVYLFLWRQTAGEDRKRVRMSHREIAEATGLSKSAVQAGLRTLVRRRLVRVDKASRTAIPAYTVLRPWIRP
jgi:phage replication O-like protein O